MHEKSINGIEHIDLYSKVWTGMVSNISLSRKLVFCHKKFTITMFKYAVYIDLRGHFFIINYRCLWSVRP